MDRQACRSGVLLLGLAGCPQFQSNDWRVVSVGGEAGPPSETGAADSASDAEASPSEAAASDVRTPDAASSGAPDADAGPSLESGASDSGADATPAFDSGPPDAAQVLYSNLASPRGVTLSPEGNICWVGEGKLASWGLFCAPVSGGTPQDITEIDQPGDAVLLQDAFDLLLDTNYVYWSNGSGNEVVRRPRAGGPAKQYFSGGDGVSFLAFGVGATIWATDFVDPPATSSGELVVGPMANSSSSNAIYTGQLGAAGVAFLAPATILWGTSDALNSGPLTGNVTPRNIVSPQTPVGGVAVDSQGTAYFLAGNRAVYRVDTGAPKLIFQENSAFGTGDVAVDSQRVYFSEPDNGLIMSIPK
jgi:hypothetical protein